MTVSMIDAERLLASRRRALDANAASRPAQCAPRSEVVRELREIEAALARISDGTYGVCERCGGAIGRDRLRALPEVRRCLACSSELPIR